MTSNVLMIVVVALLLTLGAAAFERTMSRKLCEVGAAVESATTGAESTCKR